jgi:hypothetical protein
MAHRFFERIAILAAFAFFLAVVPSLGAQEILKGLPTEKTSPPGMPQIGLWMLSSKGGTADWLGEKYKGKRLLEPINVIIVDPFAISVEDAVARLKAACEKAEFETREGHSGGYSALIGEAVCYQFPPGTEESFADAPFEVGNNHGRIFGPVPWNGAYVFTAAFSRESVNLVTKVKHQFESFDRARDAFTQKLTTKSDFKVSSFVYLGNAIPGDPELTTGDHDGMAVLLEATK